MTDPKRYEMESIRDYAGHGVQDAWETALQIAREKMELSSDAEFCDISEGTVTLRSSQWTVRGSVTLYDEQGNANRSFLRLHSILRVPNTCLLNSVWIE